MNIVRRASYSNRLGVNQEFGNGYNWQIAHLPSLEPQAGGTFVVVGHNHGMLWFDSLPGGGYAARYGVTNKLTKLADDHFLLSDTQGNVTEFLGQGLMFYAQYDAAGNVTKAVSWATDGMHPSEVQRSFTDMSGNTTIESYQYAYTLGGDSMVRLTSVTLRRQVNGGAWQNVRQAQYTFWDSDSSFGWFGDCETIACRSTKSTVARSNSRRWRVRQPGAANSARHGSRSISRAPVTTTHARPAVGGCHVSIGENRRPRSRK